ncbi:MAG: hypothetical protein LBO73_02875 [Holosporaceae bacterium]|nr:hypothetical protein [Holosporaceae bacterium]
MEFPEIISIIRRIIVSFGMLYFYASAKACDRVELQVRATVEPVVSIETENDEEIDLFNDAKQTAVIKNSGNVGVQVTVNSANNLTVKDERDETKKIKYSICGDSSEEISNFNIEIGKTFKLNFKPQTAKNKCHIGNYCDIVTLTATAETTTAAPSAEDFGNSDRWLEEIGEAPVPKKGRKKKD